MMDDELDSPEIKEDYSDAAQQSASEEAQFITLHQSLAAFLKDAFNDRSFSLLELGCGSGNLCQWLTENCRYVGVDSSVFAVHRAHKLFPKQRFMRSDISSFVSKVVSDHVRFDVVVFSRFSANYEDYSSFAAKKPLPLLKVCAHRLLKRTGYLAFLEPLDYSSPAPQELESRHSTMLEFVNRLSTGLPVERIKTDMLRNTDYAALTVITRKIASGDAGRGC
jgi:SAM-dependent methyltransferase